jgi:Dockerin type I domain/Pregnancy-associated plasma protein-A
MHRVILLLTLALVLRSGSVGTAALIINPPRPITHRVSVQVIQTALDNGSSPAALFGDATREAAIKGMIDSIWAQAGIDIHFLPNVVRYNNTFAYQGTLGGIRPISDLGTMMIDAQLQGGILNTDPSVINMFFVNVVPGWDPKSGNWANGVANIGTNGIAMFVGSTVSAEHAGHWVAHELGHNLGLEHTPSGVQNLMTGATRNTELLSSEQVAAVFQTQLRNDSVAFIPLGGTGFPRAISAILGDYNRDGQVDAGDYLVWRKTLNSRTTLLADGNANGIVDSADFGIWRSNFGKSANGSAAGAALYSQSFEGGGIPEPASAGLAFFGLASLCLAVRRRVFSGN